jgi:tRNA wybutosine-synthesizing protein 3
LITKGGKWLLSAHAPVTFDEFKAHVLVDPSVLHGIVIFKHEPFIMHVQCRDEEAAKALLQCGLACGFRESGVVLGTTSNRVPISII